MNVRTKKWLLFFVTLSLIGATAAAVMAFTSRQRLGQSGLIATPVADGTGRLKFDFPERVLDFTSTNVPEADVVLNLLPQDTSYAQRHYVAPDGAWAMANLILMGGDRTSIHRAEYCLPGQGWQIVNQAQVKLAIGGPQPYALPVQKWTIRNTYTDAAGHRQEVGGLYVFWFVTDHQTTDSYSEMLLSMLSHLVRTGELQRWAYVSWFSVCEPGKEDALFARLKPLITDAVPRFQRPPVTAGPPAK